MTRPLAALTAVTLYLTLTTAAPVPKEQGAGLYFPTRVGATRVLADGVGDDQTWVVSKVEDAPGGAKLVTEEMRVTDRNGKRAATSRVFRVAPGELTVVGGGGEKLRAPNTILKVGKVGERWSNGLPVPGQATDYTFRGVERVKVPAGAFDAARVDSESKWLGKVTESSTWYAPGVGMVKMVSGEVVRELKSFTKGKD